MDEFFEILKIILPALIVLLTTYYMLNRFMQRDTNQKLQEIKANTRKTILPMRLQAYERIILFLERIHPDNLVMRVHNPDNKAQQLHQQLLQTIRSEYEHNMTQQMYMSDATWSMVKSSKEETVKLINLAYEKIEKTDPSNKLAEQIFSMTGQLEHFPTQVAAKQVKKEVRKLF